MVVFLIPAYNEGSTIVDVLDRVEPLADRVVVVDDGSVDATAAIVHRWLQDHGKGTLLKCAVNRGMSSALKAGFTYLRDELARGAQSVDDVLVTIDADGQHVPEVTPAALEAMRARGYDVLVGRRDLCGYPRSKRIGNWLLSLWASMLAGQRLRDVECGYRLVRFAAMLDILPYYTGRGYGCAQEIAVASARRHWRLGNDFAIPVAYYRQGARVRDGLTNLAMGFLAWLRVLLEWRSELDRNVRYVVEEAPESALALPVP